MNKKALIKKLMDNFKKHNGGSKSKKISIKQANQLGQELQQSFDINYEKLMKNHNKKKK